MLFYSDEIINDVIKKFNLNDQITNAIDSARLQEKIRNRISIDVSAFNTYYLKVKWPDRYQCAAVTNYLVASVNELSLQLIQEDINTRMAVMQQVFATAGVDSTDKITQQFNLIVNELHKISTPVSKGELEEIKRLQSQYELLAKYFSDRMVMVQLNSWVMKELSSHPFHSVQSLQKATPDFSNYLLAFILYSIVIGIACCSLIPFAIFVLHKLNGKKT
ncbi:MAG: hypothetical protein LH473_10865 [Chitinophagales bacterium]|nr:hypothetical protein [Chitinophagales bacterium]